MPFPLFCAEKVFRFLRKAPENLCPAAVRDGFGGVKCLKCGQKRMIFEKKAVFRTFDTKCMELYTCTMRCGAQKPASMMEKER